MKLPGQRADQHYQEELAPGRASGQWKKIQTRRYFDNWEQSNTASVP